MNAAGLVKLPVRLIVAVLLYVVGFGLVLVRSAKDLAAELAKVGLTHTAGAITSAADVAGELIDDISHAVKDLKG
jgi:hypothetical protein